MTAATYGQPVICHLVQELASVGRFDEADWREAVDGAGGEERARWLIANTALAGGGFDPAALLVAHAVARLLELGPPAVVPRRTS